jgi:hypothetical protein
LKSIDEIMRMVQRYAIEYASSEVNGERDMMGLCRKYYDQSRGTFDEIRSALEQLTTQTERPTVGMMNHDVAAVLEGRTMGCSTLDGAQVLVRLWTAEELMERARAAGSDMAMAKAVELTTPIRTTDATNRGQL